MPFSHAGIGSTGSMWMASISSVRIGPTKPSRIVPAAFIGAISASASASSSPE